MSAHGDVLDPAALRALLGELVSRLEARGVTGSMRIVGGAALALNFPDDPAVRSTRDVDAVWEPRDGVEEVVRELAREHDLEVDWINPVSAPWLRTDPPVREDGRFVIVIATPRQLVAMKLARGAEQDLVDLGILARHLGIDSAEALVDIAYEIYGEDSVELPDGRESYVLLARDVIDSL